MQYSRLGQAAGGTPVTRDGIEYLGAGQDDSLKLSVEIRTAGNKHTAIR
jgi:hypothetical protein